MQNKIRNYQIINKLGQGSYGVIFKVLSKIDKVVKVLKQIKLTKMNQKAKRNAINQATIMGKLHHPYIVRYESSFIEDNKLNILMEYCDNGDLASYLKRQNKKALKEEKIWTFFVQICLGLQHIHKCKILHRDIKTLNIFMNKNEELKIGDLGVAKMLQSQDFAQTMVGTPFYLSPELCEEKPYNEKSDVWALGCLLYQLCTFRHPFEAANQASLILKIIRGKYSPIPQFYSKELKEMIQLCLERDYKRRPTASIILSKPKIKAIVQALGHNNAKLPEPQVKSKGGPEKKIPQAAIDRKIPELQQQKKAKSQFQRKDNLGPDNKKQVQVANQQRVQQCPIEKNSEIVMKKKESAQCPSERKKVQVNEVKLNRKQNQNKVEKDSSKQKINKQNFVRLPKPQIICQQVKNPAELVCKSKQHIESKDQFVANLQRMFRKFEKVNKIQQEYNKKQAKDSAKRISSALKAPSKCIVSNTKIKQANQAQKYYKVQSQSKKSTQFTKPTLEPKIIKVKMDKEVQSKVYQYRNVPTPIKCGGFKNEIDYQSKKVINDSHKVLFGNKQLEEDNKIQSNLNKRESFDLVAKGNSFCHVKSDLNGNIKSDKLIAKAPSISKKQPQKNAFRKKKASQSGQSISKHCRVRKGANAGLSRKAQHAYQVSKEEEDLVKNLPDCIKKDRYNTEQDLSISQSFKLKEVGHEVVMKEYKNIMKEVNEEANIQKEEFENSIQESIDQSESIIHSGKDQNFSKSQMRYNEGQYEESQNDNGDQQTNLKGVQDNKQQFVEETATQDIIKRQQNVDEEYIEEDGQRVVPIKNEEQDQEGNRQQKEGQQDINQHLGNDSKLSGRQEDEIKEQRQDYGLQRMQEEVQWSYDEEPQMPTIEEEQVIGFEEMNPYLVEQQETIQQKKQYLQKKLDENIKREDEINKLMQMKIEQCRMEVSYGFEEILGLFRQKINMEGEYTQQDEQQVDQFLRVRGLKDHRKFHNIYKIMHFEMELENTRKIIQRICKRLNQLDQ